VRVRRAEGWAGSSPRGLWGEAGLVKLLWPSSRLWWPPSCVQPGANGRHREQSVAVVPAPVSGSPDPRGTRGGMEQGDSRGFLKEAAQALGQSQQQQRGMFLQAGWSTRSGWSAAATMITGTGSTVSKQPSFETPTPPSPDQRVSRDQSCHTPAR